jgi:acyl-CoA thioesterase-1
MSLRTMNPSHHRGARPYLSLCAAAVTLGLSCSDSPAQPSSTLVPRIVALGDSLTVSPNRREAYPAVLSERLAQSGYRVEMINGGVDGDTTSDALARLDRVLTPDVRILILALGANDGLQGVPVAEIERNLAIILERALAQSTLVLLCGMEAPPIYGFGYSIAFHNVYVQLADEYDVTLMPFLLKDVVGRRDSNLPDFVHPNARGARTIADNMWPYLQPLVELMSDSTGNILVVGGTRSRP